MAGGNDDAGIELRSLIASVAAGVECCELAGREGGGEDVVHSGKVADEFGLARTGEEDEAISGATLLRGDSGVENQS